MRALLYTKTVLKHLTTLKLVKYYLAEKIQRWGGRVGDLALRLQLPRPRRGDVRRRGADRVLHARHRGLRAGKVRDLRGALEREHAPLECVNIHATRESTNVRYNVILSSSKGKTADYNA